LVLLLLPAVQKVRESASRISCTNNLHQIGLAFHAHALTYGHFPTGGNGYRVARTFSGAVPAPAKSQTWAWGYQILPFIEQSDLYNHPSDQLVSGTPVKIYFCPTRRPPTALSAGTWATFPYPRAMTDYAGNAGATTEGGDGSGTYGAGGDGLVIRLGYTGLVVPERDIPDGASNTLLVGEKHMNVAFVTTQCQADDNDGYVGGFQDDVVRWAVRWQGADLPPAPDGRFPLYDSSSDHPHNFLFGSSHPAGFQGVFGDGAVRTIRFSVDPTVFKYACKRDDVQPLNLDAL
jgi:hypothetical protein